MSIVEFLEPSTVEHSRTFRRMIQHYINRSSKLRNDVIMLRYK